MKLKVKLLRWSAGLPVAMLHEETAEELGVYIRDRISLRTPSKETFTIVEILGSLIKKNEIVVSSEISSNLNLKSGQKIDVNFAPSPKSLVFIKKKLNKEVLSKEEIREIIKDIVSNSLSDTEIALFVSAMYKFGMNFKETIFLINSILETGKKLRLKNKFIVDKHCIGGVAGNRTTLIVVPICAAAGLVCPKTSSKSITSAVGTADVMEAIAKVEFSVGELKKIIKKTKAFIIWGGSLDLVPADSKIIQVERTLNIDPTSQLLASIMSKKLALGSNYILIDIPYGKSAKVGRKRALYLKESFEKLGRHFKKKLKCVLTKGNQPIGNSVGPVLEIIDIIKILERKGGPKDLEKKSLFLAGELLEMTKKAKRGEGVKLARKILDSGKAFEKFKQIVAIQKGSLNNLVLAKFKKDLLAKRDAKVVEIDNKKINSLAKIAGCPIDKSAGLYLHFHVGNRVKKGDKVLTIYSETKSRLRQANLFYKKEKPIKFR